MPEPKSPMDFLEGNAVEVVNNLKREGSCWSQYGPTKRRYDQLVEDT
jgi:hypothetical protein